MSEHSRQFKFTVVYRDDSRLRNIYEAEDIETALLDFGTVVHRDKLLGKGFDQIKKFCVEEM